MIDPKLIDQNWEEHYVKKGDPSKPTYYIIRRKWVLTGIFSNFVSAAAHIRYALFNGWIPVVDMQNYPNHLLGEEKFGKENAWEYYFEQPLRIGLEEAYNGENIIVCKNDRGYPKVDQFVENSISLAEWRMLVKMGLLKIKPELMEEILAMRAKLFAPTDRVLGAYLRGTDYAANKPKWHLIPPPPEYFRDVMLQKVREWRCNKIFLSTEDKSIIQFFKDTFGDGFGSFCVTIDREYLDYKPGQGINAARTNRENGRYLNEKEYITEVVILSKCNCLLSAQCNGMIGAMMLAEHFENTYTFNLGRWGVYPVDWKKLVGV